MTSSGPVSNRPPHIWLLIVSGSRALSQQSLVTGQAEMTEENAPSGNTPTRSFFAGPLTAVVVLALALAFLYGTKLFHRNEGAAGPKACATTEAAIERMKPFVHGEVAALALASTPQPMPELKFTDKDGKPVKLSDFRGRNILLNLWATWCVPCRRE